jgi:RNA polymerase sigma-70 factor (ECF subfamily)
MDEDALTVPLPLLKAAQNGDESACSDLVVAVYPLIQRCVRRQIRRQDDVDDVVQEVILKVILKLAQYRGPQPLEHWISRVAVTTSYDWLRKQRVRHAVTVADLSDKERDMLEQSPASTSGLSSEVEHDLLAGLLDKLIALLHPREQVVIRLLDLEERSIREVSELTGWSESKIKVTAHRGRKKLGEHLKHLEFQQ